MNNRDHPTPAKTHRGLQTHAQIEGRERAHQTREANQHIRELREKQELEALQASLADVLRLERLQNRCLDIYLGRDPLRLVIDNTGRR